MAYLTQSVGHWPIPVNNQAAVDAATEALRRLPFGAACEIVNAHIEALPAHEIDADRLEHLANKLGRIAHMAARERA